MGLAAIAQRTGKPAEELTMFGARFEDLLRATAESPAMLVYLDNYLSVDPAMRGWVSAVASYSEPVALGAVMRSLAVGRVEERHHRNRIRHAAVDADHGHRAPTPYQLEGGVQRGEPVELDAYPLDP